VVSPLEESRETDGLDVKGVVPPTLARKGNTLAMRVPVTMATIEAHYSCARLIPARKGKTKNTIPKRYKVNDTSICTPVERGGGGGIGGLVPLEVLLQSAYGCIGL
jgi:hypothetical protein